MTVRLEHHESLPSTSGLLRERIETSAMARAPVVVVAETQTAGVGRFARRWESPRGGLWMTLAWPLDASKPLPPGLGIRFAVAASRGIESACPDLGGAARIKWPNDLLLRDRKVCGLLTERIEHGGDAWLLVGVGVNADFSVDRLPPELRAEATTLREELGRAVDPDALRDRVVGELVGVVRGAPPDSGWLEEARTRQWGVGREIEIARPGSAWVPARIVGLADDGRLLVRAEGREEAVTGSASVRPRADTPLRGGARG